MTARTCPLCGAELAPGASIDSGCLRAARWRLRDVPPLLRELDVTISRQAGRGDGGAGGDRVDFDERAAAAAAALRDVLARWVAEWARSARILAADAPAFARMMATTTGHAALLATRELTGVAWAPRLAGELRDACDEAWQRVDRPPDTSFSGWCTAPDCGRALYALEGASTVTCPGCRTDYDVDSSQRLLLATAATETADATTLGRALRIPPSTIRGWRHQQRLQQATDSTGRLLYSLDGRPLYRVADVQALALGARGLVPPARTAAPDEVGQTAASADE
jgi:hypothetical protein